jgi:hypothetical protein
MRIRDPGWRQLGSGMEKSPIRDKHPGSAALTYGNTFFNSIEYVDGVFHGTRPLKLAESRTIAIILRREYPKLFIATSGS